MIIVVVVSASWQSKQYKAIGDAAFAVRGASALGVRARLLVTAACSRSANVMQTLDGRRRAREDEEEEEEGRGGRYRGRT